MDVTVEAFLNLRWKNAGRTLEVFNNYFGLNGGNGGRNGGSRSTLTVEERWKNGGSFERRKTSSVRK